jgi:hypothetical protein
MSFLDNVYVEKYMNKECKHTQINLFIFDEESKTITKWVEAIFPQDGWLTQFQPKTRSAYIKDGLCYMIRENKNASCKTHHYHYKNLKDEDIPEELIEDLEYHVFCKENNLEAGWKAYKLFKAQ